MTRRRPLSTLLARGLAAALSFIPFVAGAQSLVPTRPWLEWETLETPHFAFHYPAEMREWTRTVAERVEAQRDAVAAIVGYAPAERTDVVIDDPYNVSNGAAFPLLGAPAILLWPVPPEPTSQIGDNRSWGEVLAVHEFTHIAHISRPSRDPRKRRLSRLAPVKLGPIAVGGSRWLWEGYATYVEGRLTGTGRPHGVWRAALLRQLAVEGQLPSYGQLDAAGGYKQGSHAYLVGSAYLEWLAGRYGDSTLVHLWRRMTARTSRSFDAAFAGVYGESPAELYGRFTAELTTRAMAAEQTLRSAGLAPGTLVQKLDWYVGDPAVSPDGTLLALQLRSRTEPTRVVVWSADSAPVSDAETKARKRQLERDPEDVPAVHPYPRARKTVASLQSATGQAFDSPRFFADGRRILLSRADPLPDGTLRADLYVWDFRSKRLRRVTHGAALRHADPSPNGRDAVAVRCSAGACDLVRVDLTSGRVSVLSSGTPTRNYYRPRYAPDGRSITFTVQDSAGVWRLGTADASGVLQRLVGPADGVNRYGSSFTRDGRSLVYVSERGGIPNLERLDLATGATSPVTRVLAAAYPPAPSPTSDELYYLSEHARGLDLYRVRLDSVTLDRVVSLPPSLAPAVQLPPVPADSFAASTLAAPRPYGLGPRRHTLLPASSLSPSGRLLALNFVSTDPAGRLAWTATGALGDREAWRGVALRAEWRGFLPSVGGSLFYAEQRPSLQRAGTFAPRAVDGDYGAATIDASLRRYFGVMRARGRLGLSAGSLASDSLPATGRTLGFAELDASRVVRRGRRFAALDLSLHGSSGRTVGEEWRRAVTSATIATGGEGAGARATVTYGVTSRAAPAYERFLVGGVGSPLVDDALLSQRVPLGAAPIGVRSGRELYAYRLSLTGLGAFAPYYAGVSTRGGFAAAFRVVGAEASLSLGDAPIIAIPAVRALAGVGYTLDEPFRKKTRAYLSIEYEP